jgi:hypothetical protein
MNRGNNFNCHQWIGKEGLEEGRIGERMSPAFLNRD